jgi:hypothetical protein
MYGSFLASQSHRITFKHSRHKNMILENPILHKITLSSKNDGLEPFYDMYGPFLAG